MERRKRPVFVLGCPRSGTTLLYDMLLSAGGFAVYLAESNVFNVIAPSFGDLGRPQNRERLLDAWLGTKLFRASGLDRQKLADQVVHDCQNAGDFLRIIMDGIARDQGMERWAENSPEGILYLPAIKKLIPEALVIHMIRDGRDVAMSLNRVRYLKPLPWQGRISLAGAGAYWEWIVERGRGYGSQLGPDYMEVHFEELVSEPRGALSRISRFISQQLDYDRIVEVAYGAVSKPNTSFGSESDFNPVGRWKQGFTARELVQFESMVGATLSDTGYMLSTHPPAMDLRARAIRWFYRAYFNTKLWLKRQTLLRRLRPLTAAMIDAMVLAEDHPPEIKTTVSAPAPGGGGPC